MYPGLGRHAAGLGALSLLGRIGPQDQVDADRAAPIGVSSSLDADSKAAASNSEALSTSADCPELSVQGYSGNIGRIAAQADNINWNVPMLVAETVIFSGAMLYKWASSIRRTDRMVALGKTALTLGFLALYPYYAAITIIIMLALYLTRPSQ